jgi:hypothetical protein
MKRRRFVQSLSAMSLLPLVGKFEEAVRGYVGSTNVAVDGPLDIGSERQLFIDEHFIAEKTNVTLTVNPPRKTGERNIVAEHPWESFRVGAWNTVMQDGDTYKLWYDAASSSDPDSFRKGMGRFVCHAASRDGIHWEKPVLGLVEFEGSKKNNILMRDTTGSVFLDPKKTGGDRFKYVGWWFGDGQGVGLTRVWIFTSPDGLKWRPQGDRPIMAEKSQFDTQNQIFWDERVGRYVAYVRHNEFRYKENGERYTIRKTHRAESADLSRWPATKLVFAPDEADPPFSDHYNIGANKYPYAPNVYFGFPSGYLHTDRKGRIDDRLDIQLVTSRDGVQWNRLDRRPYLRLGVSGQPDSGSIYMTLGMLRQGDEVWMYYTGFDFTHGGFDLKTTRNKGVISRLVQRLDGFTSADAAYTGGKLRTRLLNFKGNKLIVNVDTGAMGSLRVAILDKAGQTIPGYGEKDCDMVNGNYINRVITWNGKSEVGPLSRTPVQLVFLMRSTKLYAFQFTS